MLEITDNIYRNLKFRSINIRKTIHMDIKPNNSVIIIDKDILTIKSNIISKLVEYSYTFFEHHIRKGLFSKVILMYAVATITHQNGAQTPLLWIVKCIHANSDLILNGVMNFEFIRNMSKLRKFANNFMVGKSWARRKLTHVPAFYCVETYISRLFALSNLLNVQFLCNNILSLETLVDIIKLFLKINKSDHRMKTEELNYDQNDIEEIRGHCIDMCCLCLTHVRHNKFLFTSFKSMLLVLILESIHSSIKTNSILLKLVNKNLLWPTCVRPWQHMRVQCPHKSKIR
ncbi:hypothetical protein AGLY_009466 [Aphis glycines]|uniref:Uncharacterized protein n=1 Tax=Aphis glycines TaxID=307491 RepID=A0A6G0TID9_APHGL|nr:hypothetical protein AGLY_009466 [Aphis glycines]